MRIHLRVNHGALWPDNLWMPAENLGFPHEAYVTPAFTLGAWRPDKLIRLSYVADWQQSADARDDKASAGV